MTFLQDWMKYLTQYAVISFEKNLFQVLKVSLEEI
jgi:hypothetical protein